MLITLLLALSAHAQQVVDTNRELIDALARGDKAVGSSTTATPRC